MQGQWIRLEKLEKQRIDAAADQSDFRVAGRPKWQVLDDVASVIEQRLTDPSLSPERRAELEVKAARARQSAQRHRESERTALGAVAVAAAETWDFPNAVPEVDTGG